MFLSSNTSEYLNDSKVLKVEIANDFAPLKIDYASNMAMAKYQLGSSDWPNPAPIGT